MKVSKADRKEIQRYVAELKDDSIDRSYTPEMLLAEHTGFVQRTLLAFERYDSEMYERAYADMGVEEREEMIALNNKLSEAIEKNNLRLKGGTQRYEGNKRIRICPQCGSQEIEIGDIDTTNEGQVVSILYMGITCEHGWFEKTYTVDEVTYTEVITCDEITAEFNRCRNKRKSASIDCNQ